MTDNLVTELDRTSAPTPEAQADALAYLIRNGHGDLAEMLGLVESGPATRRGTCPSCKQPYRAGRWECRHADCDRGPAARGVKR